MRRVTAVVAVVVVLATVPMASGVSFDDPVLETPPADRVNMTADIEETAAHWRVDYRYRLDDNDSVAAFESLRGNIETDTETYTDGFRARLDDELANDSVAAAQDMDIDNVTVETTRIDDYGVVTYRFLWAEFARRNDSGLLVDDGLTVLSLGANTSLTLTFDDRLHPKEMRPVPDEQTNTSVTYHGPQSFTNDSRLTLELEKRPPFRDATPSLVGPIVAALLIIVVVFLIPLVVLLFGVRSHFTD